ncbi:glycosyltransferase [Leptolyngbya sp. AN02str]|uniref:glycosyltransferase family 2 protein n=1 Tax=Leptolyngbya sp. AN02str TaxID=3423363 RepID=UPI003D313526
MPKVSVIIPAYNSMKYLPETVASVQAQTFRDYEVLIVDDGSSDSIYQWYGTLNDPRIQLIKQMNQGASTARNTGIAKSTGEYLAFLDADDLWLPTKLENQVHLFERSPECGLVHTWLSLIDANGRRTGRTFQPTTEGHAWAQLVERNTIGCCSVMVRRECFDAAGVFDTSLRSAEDWDMWLRIAAQYPIGLVPKPLALYRLLPSSKSKNCQLVEASLTQIIEKTFRAVTPDYAHLKNHSYGYAYLNLAWKSIQSYDRDWQRAIAFQRQALQYHPKLSQSRDYWRLSLAIASMRCLGSQNYSTLLHSYYRLRNLI